MVMQKNAKGITLISGAGGTGRTTVAQNLAQYLARQGNKVLLFDMCFGWGGLSLNSDDLLSYDDLLDTEDDLERAVARTEHGFDIFTCIPPDFLDPIIEDLKKIAWLANRLGSQYDYIVFDPPSGGHPLALLSAGLSDRVFLFARPEATSVASSYSLLKSLHAEGINSRVRTVFAQVESPEQAASLKTRFDLMTSQFLGFTVADGGYVYRLDDRSDDFLCQDLSEESEQIIRNIKIDFDTALQSETRLSRAGIAFPDLNQGRR
jgi:flagellar biosynthesis protein FlhG